MTQMRLLASSTTQISIQTTYYNNLIYLTFLPLNKDSYELRQINLDPPTSQVKIKLKYLFIYSLLSHLPNFWGKGNFLSLPGIKFLSLICQNCSLKNFKHAPKQKKLLSYFLTLSSSINIYLFHQIYNYLRCYRLFFLCPQKPPYCSSVPHTKLFLQKVLFILQTQISPKLPEWLMESETACSCISGVLIFKICVFAPYSARNRHEKKNPTPHVTFLNYITQRTGLL